MSTRQKNINNSPALAGHKRPSHPYLKKANGGGGTTRSTKKKKNKTKSSPPKSTPPKKFNDPRAITEVNTPAKGLPTARIMSFAIKDRRPMENPTPESRPKRGLFSPGSPPVDFDELPSQLGESDVSTEGDFTRTPRNAKEALAAISDAINTRASYNTIAAKMKADGMNDAGAYKYGKNSSQSFDHTAAVIKKYLKLDVSLGTVGDIANYLHKTFEATDLSPEVGEGGGGDGSSAVGSDSGWLKYADEDYGTDFDTDSAPPTPASSRPSSPSISGPSHGGAGSLSSGSSIKDDDHEGEKEEEAKKTEKVIIDKAMNKDSEGGDSNLKAAGDSGMGNPLNYDFIRGEGRGSTGQNVLAGDQTTNKMADNERTKEERKGDDPMAKNAYGQNQQLTQKDLIARIKDNAGSDKILDPVTYDHGRASLRPQFLLGGEDAVRKTAREKMEMDAQFDMFDFVPEGFGLGSHNKMFIQEQNRDRLIRYAEPMFEPRPKDGSELTNDQFDARLMPQMTNTQNYLIRQMNEMSEMGETVKRQKVSSMNTLADDNNSIRSSKGLRGRNPSPFEPVIQTRSQWIPTIEPAGVNMKRQLKSIFNTQRAPQRHVEYNPHNGMQTLDRRRAMEIILP